MVVTYININQQKLVIRAIIFSKFEYCPLGRMFHSRGLNIRINNIYERVLRIIYTVIKDLLELDNSVPIHKKKTNQNS